CFEDVRYPDGYVILSNVYSGVGTGDFVAETEWVLHNIEEEEKEDVLGSHSEKLALAFALISGVWCLDTLLKKNEDEAEPLYYLHAIYKDEWANFLECMKHEEHMSKEESVTTYTRELYVL
ncbi:hypothetical protein Tco_0076001, partial [Tanacetum coccineum]